MNAPGRRPGPGDGAPGRGDPGDGGGDLPGDPGGPSGFGGHSSGSGGPGGPGRPGRRGGGGPGGPRRPGGGGSGSSGGGTRPGGPSGGRPAKRRNILWRLRRPLFLLALLGLVGMAGIATLVARTELPEIDPLQQTTFICGADVQENCNSQNAMARVQGGEDRVNVSYEDIPQVVIDAVVATEDRDFFEHRGVDPVGIARALYQDIRGGGNLQGGSTITQQYVENVFLDRERSITQKIEEAVLAVKIEQQMSKEEILEGYLNTIYFGRGAYGVAAASQAYFGKSLDEIGVAEAAYLAGLIRAPVLADASENPEEAQRRRHVTLVAMQQEGYITEEEAELADAVPFTEPYFRPNEGRRLFETGESMRNIGGDYITAYVNHLLETEHGLSEEEIAGGGYRVYTTIDPMMQDAAWRAVYETLNQPTDPVGSLVAIDQNGYVRAMVGGRNFEESQVNHAVRGLGSQGQQVGSTFKPIALAEFVRRGMSLESTYNAPSEMVINEDPEHCEPWRVRNYEESDEGALDVREATAVSSNTAYGQIMWDVGPENVIRMAHDLGMTGDISPPCGPIVLGTELSTPLEMASVYSVFANEGIRREPTIITRIEQVDQDGNATVIWEHRPSERRVLTAEQANTVTDVLQDVITEGTGTAADIGRPAAGKTGTAQANRDAWFIGYTPRLTAAVWMGYTTNDWDDPETPEVEQLRPPMNGEHAVRGRNVTGGSFPAEIWARFMRNVHDHYNWNDPFPEVSEEILTSGEIVGSTPTTQAPPDTTIQPDPSQPTVPPDSTSTTVLEPPSTSTTSSSIPTTSTTEDPPFPTLPTTPPPTEPGPGRPGNDNND